MKLAEKFISKVVEARWPAPKVKRPSNDVLNRALDSGECPATDGCMVEPDGECPHGYPSWLVYLELI